ncbi:MAG: hypothetical protein JRS35_12645, partial [Deltaproteobacteria bacterium]|nr:hypothetical protein [Deltaproteobacteria bacterium]
MKPELPFDELGAWSQVPADLQPPLVEDRRADVVVIGGMSAVDQTARVPEMVPSGKAIVSAWAAYPKTVGLMGQPDDVLIQT